MKNNYILKFNNKSTIFLCFLFLFSISSTIKTNCQILEITDQSQELNFQEGDYLIYEVEIVCIYLSNNTIVEYWELDDGINVHLKMKGELNFEIIEVNDTYVSITSNIVVYSPSEMGNNQIFSDIVYFNLEKNKNKIYLDSKLWGYFPFIHPLEIQDCGYTGIIEYPYTITTETTDVIEKSNKKTIYGYQECLIVRYQSIVKSNTTTQIVRNTYDNSIRLAYTIFAEDPWWSIFPKNFEIGGSTINLVESNVDFGPSNDIEEEVIKIIMFFAGPGLILLIGSFLFSIFFVLRRQNRVNNKHKNRLKNSRRRKFK